MASEPVGKGLDEVLGRSPYPWDKERRAFPRWPVALEGTCYGAWGSSRCLIAELSENGISLVSGHALSVGDLCDIAWRLSAAETPIHVTCIVRQISDRQIGLEFLDATRSDRVRIRQFVRRRTYAQNA